MAVIHKEENFVVIELGGHTTKAVRDTTEINKLPTVQVRTRAGILKTDNEKNDEAENKQQDGQTEEPKENAQDDDAQEEETVKKPDDGAAEPETQEPSYVFGSALEAADASTVDSIVDMIVDGYVRDWDALSAFLRYILKELQIRISENICPILFSIPPMWSKTDHECLVQIAFEHLNTPCVVVTEQPLMAVFGNGSVNGLVVDIGHSSTTVTAVIDSCVMSSSIMQSPVAGLAVTNRLHELLASDRSVTEQLGDSADVSADFVCALKESGLCSFGLAPVAADEGEQGKDGSFETFEFDGKKCNLPKKLLRQAPEILIRPPAASASIGSLMKQAVLSCEVEKRVFLWESIHVVGGSSKFAGIKDALQVELETTILPTSNIFANSQSREIKFGSIPDYFIGWRNCDHWAAFLGACIMAKVTMNDARHNVTRAEYNENGPSVIHTKAY
ncbi:hypothetical protein FB645_004075 [Coemansia sp. IMI 203386]|nr:hypothetical protein FB645_004075 [Coemansia sp. IMI 203386]